MIGQTLVSASARSIRRVIVFSFSDEEVQAAFFADPACLAVRAQHFAPAVDGFTTLAKVGKK